MFTRYITLISFLMISLTSQAQVDRNKNPQQLSPSQVDRSKAPIPGPAPKINIGKYESFTLKNGLKVIVVENHKLPVVSYSLLVDMDPALEGNKAGFVDMFGQMLSRGTANKTKAQLDEAIDLLGAQLSTSDNGLYASSLKKHNDKLLQLMAEVIMNPSFPKDELDKVVKQTIDGLSTVKTDAGQIASNLTSKVAYGTGHPYGDIITEETVKNITLEDIKEFYSKNFMPNTSYLAIVGDVTKAEIQPLIEKYFEKWAKGSPVKNKLNTPQPPSSAQIVMNDRPGSAQSTLRIVYPVQNKVGDADYIKLRVLNNILGGGATGRLFMNLREKHGYTYGAYSSISADKNVGLFTASADVRTEVTDSAIYQFIYEMNKISNQGVTQEELNNTKSELTGSFAIGLENPQTVANFAINIDRYKLAKDYYQNYLTTLNAITLEEVNDVAKRYILPYNFNLIVVGDRSAVEKKIMKYDSDEKITFLDPFGRPAAELKSVPEGTTLQTVLDNYLKAIGGKDKVKAVKDVTMKGKLSAQFGVLDVTSVYKTPFKKMDNITMGDQTVQKSVFDGTTGKTDGMQGAAAFSEEELKDAKAQSAAFFELDLAAIGVTGKLLGIDLLDGKDAYKVEYILPSGSKTYSWYHVKTNLLAKTSAMQKSDQGSVEVVTEYSDYREINGVSFPFNIKTLFGDIVMEKIEINTGVKDDVFSTK
jgi:predicted Zn-dependent peptidase